MVKDDVLNITTKADVWGLGCILLQLSSGCLWPADMSPHEIVGEIHDEQAPAIPDTLPSALQDVLTGCFQARPEERLTMEAVLQASASNLALAVLVQTAVPVIASCIAPCSAVCQCSVRALG